MLREQLLSWLINSLTPGWITSRGIHVFIAISPVRTCPLFACCTILHYFSRMSNSSYRRSAMAPAGQTKHSFTGRHAHGLHLAVSSSRLSLSTSW